MSSKWERHMDSISKYADRVTLWLLYVVAILGAAVTFRMFNEIKALGESDNNKFTQYLVEDAPAVIEAMMLVGVMAAFAGSLWTMRLAFRLSKKAAKRIKRKHPDQRKWTAASWFVDLIPVFLLLAWIYYANLIDAFFIVFVSVGLAGGFTFRYLTPWGKRMGQKIAIEEQDA